jgi:hypothetical protein
MPSFEERVQLRTEEKGKGEEALQEQIERK